jgi:hypothetical protein
LHGTSGIGAAILAAAGVIAAHIGTHAEALSCLFILVGWCVQSAAIDATAVKPGASTQASAAEVEPAANDRITKPRSSRRNACMREYLNCRMSMRQPPLVMDRMTRRYGLQEFNRSRA